MAKACLLLMIAGITDCTCVREKCAFWVEEKKKFIGYSGGETWTSTVPAHCSISKQNPFDEEK